MIVTECLYIRLPQDGDAKLLKRFEEKNKEHLRPWTTLGEFTQTPDEWNHRLVVWLEEYNHDKAIRFLLFSKENKDTLIGMCNYTHIIRGPLQACYLGYKIDYEFAGKGLMTEALQATILHMFNHYNLHRIMANYQPTNTASARLLRNIGFKVDGYAYDYLVTETGWQDHILTSLINRDWNYSQEHS